MLFKKALSVFLAAVMLFSVMSIGITGAAAEIDYETQYKMLANALKNEHVRELTNYKVVNEALDNTTYGFDQEAKGFAYDHVVFAQDNQKSDILKASNRFFYIAEALMSFQYGVGCYDANTLMSYVTDKIRPYFSTEGGNVVYEDFYGNRYYPTEEEVAAYNDAVESITASGGEIDKLTLPTYGIYFIEKDLWDYYNVETILRYFMGNNLNINAGNYFHRFSFIVQSSVNVYLEDCEGVLTLNIEDITIRTAAYQFAYQKFYNESMSKTYYTFAEPSLDRVWESYGRDYGFKKTSVDLTTEDQEEITHGGQASAYLIKTHVDNKTVPLVKNAYSAFRAFLEQQHSNVNYIKWDEAYTVLTDAEIQYPYEVVKKLGFNPDADNNANVYIFKDRIDILKSYGDQIFSDTFSNAALLALYGNDLGNMITLYYLFKPTTESPKREVRDDAYYTASPERIDKLIYSLDALVSNRDTGDQKIAQKVTTLLKNFLDIGALLGVEEPIEYSTLDELVGKVLSSLVFTDSIVTMLVKLLYPMIVDLIVNNIGNIEVVGSTAVNLISSIIDGNGLAIYPNTLASLINTRYPGKYPVAVSVLSAAGDDWNNVNFDNITWGVDATAANKKADAFLDALCAGLCGFTNLLVCFLCGSDEVLDGLSTDEENAIKKARQGIDGAKLGKLYDIELVSELAWVHSQGLYTKLFITLYRVLGIPESMYMTTYEYEMALNSNTNNCLRNAVEPLIRWITNVVAKKPFETIMKLLPNLVHFLSREGTTPLSNKSKWQKPDFATDQEGSHRGFADLQTYNLYDILDNTYLSVVGSTLLFGANLYTTSIASLIGGNTLGMLKSINDLLNEFIDFSYETDIVADENYVCYTDAQGNIVPYDSEEYAANPGKYPTGHYTYYSDVSNTKYSLTKDDEHPYEHKNYTYYKEDYHIPAIPEGKLISVGPITENNTIDVQHPGKVFIFLLRFVLSALGYKYNINDTTLPTLIECLGIELEGELFLGLSLGDIIYNVMIHPDEALCALLELFQSGETGDFFERKAYTYPLDEIDYHNSVLLNKAINPTRTYGSPVKYSQYWTKENADGFIASLTPLAEDILGMLDIEGMEDGLGGFLRNLIEGSLFTNDLVNTVFNLIYQLIGGLGDSLGFDIEGILDAVLDVSFKPSKIAATLFAMIGHETPAQQRIASLQNWSELFLLGYETDPVTQELIPIIGDVELDWGIESKEWCKKGCTHSTGEVFLKTLAALLSPAGFLIKFLFMDKDLSILGLINIPGYAGYQFAFIGLLEALSCPDILTYTDYYKLSSDEDCGDANAIYYLFSPILSLLEKAYADPLNVVLSLIPNLLFFISIGGLNDFVNNLVHFAYVLLDILKPIVNGYDLVAGLLANLDIAGLSLQLSLPLDIDFNALVSDLLGSLLGDTLTIEGISIRIPYIDLYTLCVGTLERFNSKELRTTVFLNATGGGDLLTAILRVALEVLFMKENHTALSQIIAGLAEEGRLDAYDEETLYMIVHGLIGLVEEYQIIDIVLFAVYMLVTALVPIADTLAERLDAADLTITELIDSAGNQDEFMANIGKLLEDKDKVEVPGTVDEGEAVTTILDKLKLFFAKIKMFFQNLFSFG